MPTSASKITTFTEITTKKENDFELIMLITVLGFGVAIGLIHVMLQKKKIMPKFS